MGYGLKQPFLLIAYQESKGRLKSELWVMGFMIATFKLQHCAKDKVKSLS